MDNLSFWQTPYFDLFEPAEYYLELSQNTYAMNVKTHEQSAFVSSRANKYMPPVACNSGFQGRHCP